MGTTEAFRNFDKRLEVTDESRDSALDRSVQCVVALTNQYYGSTANAADHMTFIGSFAKQTTIPPISDVDVVFHLPPGTYKRFSDYTGNGQSALLQEVRSVISKRYPMTEIKGDGPVVVVKFTTGASVEVVPGALVENANILGVKCEVPVTRNGGYWETADYGAQFKALNVADGPRRGQLNRLVRYMKSWRRTHNAVIASVAIELMATSFVDNWDTAQTRTGYLYDDWLVRDFLAYMVANQDTTYRLPGTGKPITAGFGWRADAKQSMQDAATACKSDGNSSTYLTYWKRVFGNGFGS